MPNATDNRKLPPPEQYVIRIKGHLDPRWSEWFEGLTVTHTESGETVLSGPVVDQSALHGLLARIRDLNLPLISVTRLEPGSLTGEKDMEQSSGCDAGSPQLENTRGVRRQHSEK